MGTDIHGVFQRRANGGWVEVPSQYKEDRHYQLFAVLAGVRNGYGFAGVETGEEVQPISEPRGLPADFVEGEKWLGDHSHSWLLGTEILKWAEKAPTVTQTGIVSRAVYDAWDGVSKPASYCGGISGFGVLVIRDNSFERQQSSTWTHIRIEWQSSLKDELAYFFEEVSRLVAEHGEVRFVFGFDS